MARGRDSIRVRDRLQEKAAGWDSTRDRSTWAVGKANINRRDRYKLEVKARGKGSTRRK